MELVRYYLYNWGFACSSFYDHCSNNNSSSLESPIQPKSQDLLLAIAWLLAFSRFFERLRGPILEVMAALVNAIRFESGSLFPFFFTRRNLEMR